MLAAVRFSRVFAAIVLTALVVPRVAQGQAKAATAGLSIPVEYYKLPTA